MGSLLSSIYISSESSSILITLIITSTKVCVLSPELLILSPELVFSPEESLVQFIALLLLNRLG